MSLHSKNINNSVLLVAFSLFDIVLYTFFINKVRKNAVLSTFSALRKVYVRNMHQCDSIAALDAFIIKICYNFAENDKKKPKKTTCFAK